MGFRIKAKDLTIEVDTQEEFGIALRIIRALEEKSERHEKSEKRENTPALFPTEKPPIPDKLSIIGLSKEEKLNQFYEYIKTEGRGNMAKLINVLATTSEFLSPKKIGEGFDILTEGIGGTVGSITKVAAKYGLTRDDILLREHSKLGSRFQLSPAMREVVLAEPQREQGM